MLFAVSFGVAVAYWGGIAAFAVMPRWAVLCVVPAMLFGVKVKMRAAHWAGLALLVYATASLSWTTEIHDGIDGWAKLWLVAGVFMLGSTRDDLTQAYEGFALGLTVLTPLVIAQYLGWSYIQQFVPPAATFGNKNFLGEAAALALIGVIGTKRGRWLAVGPIVCLVFSQCREAWIAAAVGLMVPFWIKGYRKEVLSASVMAAGAIVLVSLDHMGDFRARIEIWHDTITQLTWLGHGVGSFMTEFPHFATWHDVLHDRPEFAHNDGLQLIFELGAVGFILGVSIAILCVGCASGNRGRAVGVALAVETLLGFPMHMPATALMAALVAGHLSRTSPDLRAVVGRWRTACQGCMGWWTARAPFHGHT